jgi:hypothetical protein
MGTKVAAAQFLNRIHIVHMFYLSFNHTVHLHSWHYTSRHSSKTSSSIVTSFPIETFLIEKGQGLENEEP